MAATRYVVQLKGHAINGSPFSCEGEQIALIVETLGDSIEQCVWFVSDIDDQRGGPRLFAEGVKNPALVGDRDETVAFLRQVVQFIWAVFLAVPVDHLPVNGARSGLRVNRFKILAMLLSKYAHSIVLSSRFTREML